MRRNALFVAVGLVVLMIAAGSFAMRGSAQDDAVPVLQTQVADLSGRVGALETAIASPSTIIISGDGKTFHGIGNQIVDLGPMYGVYIARGIVPGTSNIYIQLTGRTTGYEENIAYNISGPIDAQTIINLRTGDSYLMEIHAEGEWTMTFEHA